MPMTSDSAKELIKEATRRQIRAADPTISAWVAASAGSGKTKVLIDRFMRLLLANTKPQHILCLTYTKAAAAEMTHRVMARLGHWTICPEEALAKDLAELTAAAVDDKIITKARGLFAHALDCPGGLKIKTFHAFAQEILARFPLEAGVPPHFMPLEDQEAKALQDAALDHILAHLDDTVTQASWRHLIGLVGVEKIQEFLKSFMHDTDKFNHALQRHHGLVGIDSALCSQLGVVSNQTPEEYLEHTCTDAQLPIDLLRRTVTFFLTDKTTSATAKSSAQNLAAWLANGSTARATSIQDYRKFFLTQDNAIRATLLNKKQADAHPELLTALLDHAVIILGQIKHFHSLQRLATTRAILHLGQKLQCAYHDAKRNVAALDFDDIIAMTDNLLHEPGVAPWVLWKLDGGIDHIMIDEAQDTSPAQWRIIRALTEEFFSGLGAKEKQRTMFVVGDEKQSIYSFQHADPQEFHRQCAFFQEAVTNAGQDFEIIALNLSFRSAPQILRAVDDIFHGAAGQGVSTTTISHAAAQQDAVGTVEVWPIIRALVDDDTAGDWEPLKEYHLTETPHAALAAQIAARIKDWCTNGQTVNGQIRSIKPGDIMILVRRRNELVQALVRELKRNGIPVSGIDRMQINTQIGVCDLLAVIQCALLPEDDLNLACVLRSPLIGLDDTVLENICFERPDKTSVWQALRETTFPAARTAYAWLDALRALADRMTPHVFLSHILTQPCPAGTSGRSALRARLGADATDPIDELLNRAQNFTTRHTPGLQSFLSVMLRDDGEIKRELDHGAGEVRIMTVHAAKGLQAPIVILPDTCAIPRAQELPALQWDATTLLPYYTGGSSATRDDFAQHLRSTAQDAQLAEYRRLLYVALTRAEDQLYIYGYLGKRDTTAAHWHQSIRTALCPNQEAEPNRPLITLVDPTTPAPKHEVQPTATSRAILPSWANIPAPPETMLRSLSPSQLSSDDGVPASPAQTAGRNQATHGRLLHLLLQYLPEFSVTEQASAATRFLERHAANTPPEQRAGIVAEIMRILTDPRYAPLFAPGSRAEVSIAGTLGDLPISGQIDRMVILDDSIMVVDYKTTRPPPAHLDQVPRTYRQQMAAYRALLQQIAPAKIVRCYLLWTYTGQIMELPDNDPALLDQTAA